jgi:crotonobetainyl-CoA:carnitine CoA-transferase CaiB-like acyl-CoA transferase
VIKVEPSNGDSYRYQGGTVDGDISPDFHLCNRGKLSIVLNARNDAV